MKRVKVRRLEAEGRNEIVDEMMRCMESNSESRVIDDDGMGVYCIRA